MSLDASTKTVVVDELYVITKNLEETIIDFKKYFSQYKGKNPEQGVKWPE